MHQIPRPSCNPHGGVGQQAHNDAMADDLIRVHLSDDYYEHEQFGTVPQTWWSKNDIYDVPREQLQRWEAASEAWTEAQAEMAKLMNERRKQQQARQATQRQREDARLAEIRAGLYGGRKTT